LAMYICMKNLQYNQGIMINCKIIKNAPSDECVRYPKMVKCIIFKCFSKLLIIYVTKWHHTLTKFMHYNNIHYIWHIH